MKYCQKIINPILLKKQFHSSLFQKRNLHHFSSIHFNPIIFCFCQNNKKQTDKQDQPGSKGSSNLNRLKVLKQQKNQEQYQQKLQKINMTTGSFNPFTSYLKINKWKLFMMMIGIGIIYAILSPNSPLCYKTIEVYEDPFTKKKRLMLVNSYKEFLLENEILDILGKQVDFVPEDAFLNANVHLNKIFHKKIQAILGNLQAKYGIKFATFDNRRLNFLLLNEQQSMMLWVLGRDKLVLSKSILKLSNQQIECLILLMHSLYSRFIHLQKISLAQKAYLKPTDQTVNKIKIDKIFLSNRFASSDIIETIDLISTKYGNNPDQQNLKQKIQQALIRLFTKSTSIQSNSMIRQLDLRKRLNSWQSQA